MEKIAVNLAISDTYLKLNLDELKRKIDYKNTFILYITSSSCYTCKEFNTILNNYITISGAEIFAIDVDENEFSPNNSLISYEYSPTIVLVKDGVAIEKNNPFNNECIFVSSSNLKEYMDTKITINHFRDLKSSSELNQVINKSKAYIYYYYSRCSDCAYFYNNAFNEYRLNMKDFIYGFEMSYYFENIDEFYTFCDSYQLSEKSNPSLGYKNGVVPVFHYYQDGKLQNSCIIYNDEFIKQYDLNGEIESLKLTSSYYKDNPFIGKIFKRNYNESAKNVYHRETLDYYFNKFKNFVKL